MIYTVPENIAYVIERKGAFHTVATAGRLVLMPFVDKIANKVLLTEQTMEILAQPMISWDNQTSIVRSHITYKVTSPQAYTYGVANAPKAIEYLVITTMRNLFGDLRKPEMVSKHTELKNKILAIITDASKTWGVEILDMDYQIVK